MDWLRTLLEMSPLTTLFLVIAAGYLVGEINVKGFALGSGAVLFVGLACGAFAPKVALPGLLGTLGLLLFLYCVGIQYGGEWYRGLKSASGLRANAVGCCGLAASAAVALIIQRTGDRRPAGIAGDVRRRDDEYPGAAGRPRRARQPGRRGWLQPRVPVWRRRTDPVHVRLCRDLQAEGRRGPGSVDEAGRGPGAERDARRTAIRRPSAEPAERRAGGGHPQWRTEPGPGCRPPSSGRTT